MNGFPPGFLAGVHAAMTAPQAAPPPPPDVVAPPQPWQPTDPLADARAVNAPGAGVMNGYDPLKADAPLPPPPPPAPEAGPPAPPGVAVPAGARSGGNEYPLLAVPGGGVIKAHELERRGPSLLSAQNVRNQASDETIGRVQMRNENTAAQEYSMALDQERQARAREAATQQSFAERDEEMAQRQSDFDGTVRQLGKLGTIDRDRFWASRSTGQKIAGLIELAASGFNRAPSLLMKRIDDDVKAQEFAFYATRDTAQAKQTAFSQAMQKYQNADAARAAARAAGVDTVQAQFAQMGAKWKGTEAANRADMASAALQDERMMLISNGVQFIPAQSVGRRYLDPRTGLTYSEAEAKAMSGKVDERDFENRKQTAGVGGQLAVEEAKAQAELQKAHNEKEAYGPLGKAGSEKLAVEAKQAEMERDSFLKAIRSAKSNLPTIVNGGQFGAAASHLPAFVPGVTDARNAVNDREAYNIQARMAVGAAYKLSTDSTEPKRMELLNHYSEPYVVLPHDNEETARHRMDLLEKLLKDGAPTKGAAPEPPQKMPASFQQHGGE